MKLNYPKPSLPIHCKFYLLRNSVNGSTRLIFGSANLSMQAFSNKNSQFVHIIILDDHEYFNLYLRRYEYIKQNFTSDFISPAIIREYQRQGESQHFSQKNIDIVKMMKEEIHNDISKFQTVQSQIKNMYSVPEMIHDKVKNSDTEEREAINIRQKC